ncbi:hypothetical protein B488_10450 [Liberibacter crescens BT-1]|uniref:Uncharacterized protein n=1 Tax=Liberibacter crescens (strain BT-1) TaxID=1215343 RepID=L0EVS8_LIBCB|nr:hypothetical protein B488_10450 [Liberibacter crescens BT-1]
MVKLISNIEMWTFWISWVLPSTTKHSKTNTMENAPVWQKKEIIS